MTPSLPPLTTELWTRVRDEFSALIDLSAGEQNAVVARLERAEPVVAAHVSAMLRASDKPSPLDASIGPIIDDLLSTESIPLPSERFGPYRIVKPLGRGGMGIVYLGQRDDLDALAAIKILPHAWIDPTRRQQFAEEMKILAELSHESIAGLLHAGQLPDGTPWFAMQYVEGEPITQWVWRNGLATDDILRLFDRLCAAVQHAHGHPIVHRDLKPSNALVTSAGAVKLLDFGIAKRLPSLQATTGLRTITREVTVEYAAPEQLRGEAVGVRADVYALGVMLFELLAGRRPYDISDLSPSDAEAAIRAAYPWSVARAPRGREPRAGAPSTEAAAGRALRADERRDIDALLCKATAPDAGQRYTSVEQMRRDIQAFLERKPLLARGAGWQYRARKFVRREWRGLSAAAVLALTATAALTLHNRALRASRDVAIAEAARVTRLRQYLEDLFQGGPNATGPLDSIRVATIVENGIRGARSLNTDPAIQVELLGTLGSIAQRMGTLPRADSLFLLAVDRSTAVNGPDHPETLRARIRRAQLLAQLGKPDSAERELRAVDAVAMQLAASRHPVVAEADVALGTVLREASNYPEAIVYLERAVAAQARRDSTSREYAEALRELGIAVALHGDLARADTLASHALVLARRLLGPTNPEVSFLLSNLGNTASQRGRLVEAERYQREAVAIDSAWYGPDHYLTAALAGPLAQTLIRLQRFDEAVPLARKTIDVFSKSPDIGANSPNTYIARSTLAVALVGQGDHAAALREYERAFDGLRRTTGESGRNTIVVGGSLAIEILQTGHADSAAALLRRMVTLGTAAFGEDAPAVADLRAKLGQVLVAQRRFPEAITMTTAALKVLDEKLGRAALSAQAARQSLLAAYVASGDSANASRVRSELADTVRAAAKH